MKKNTHPEYRQVLFVDSSTGYKFVCGSTYQSEKTEVFEGKEYPVCYVSVSSSSHPFFTGSKKFVDAEGRVDKFLKRYSNVRQPAQQPQPEEDALPAAKGKKKVVTKKKK
ncbi:ribosomal protein L31 [Chlamydia pneumoniae TW-183]|uniref:Large ribosomal subunit protein bL31B n=3 Tax=Chlamydia pneumoniae TaxID=83558 RepID=RL31B_CHLPN|nr:type B 50S ribosomal protein L31 [Chlamydia pneumoniae]Q9Z969.1 RecName: Full=Large ribosomal subunit protein bL31B; AltName: Full=50S ribosomal protein L31 type B [Chlamydia pneumoniae]AAD18265.1 L31 Ribosomal Protein [Chlamydia pneumoniae CWL029]AAF38473.1 ribosomal protein L31 [Chlamydia pneumoniae AR39]AAP98046.1 ribosomal protein L31 [Chlamydia pneumoniae TW-183]ACZ33093.1 ribosomal protein L31 [Chlamydia pneumoniae LPCoLN]ETR79997.1 LSU ribosomal protein L31p [Chlamydia pneumoniae B2